MTSDPKKEYRISVRVDQEDYTRLESLRSLLKQKKGRSVRVTQRTVIVEALTFLEQHLKKSPSGSQREFRKPEGD
jgi:hypothetical protein